MVVVVVMVMWMGLLISTDCMQSVATSPHIF